MLAEYIDLILYITGGITMSMFLQFLAPRTCLRLFNKLEFEDERAIFFIRHWSLGVCLFGILLVWAGYDPSIRTPVLFTACIGKGSFVIMILMHIKSFTRTFTHVAIFDSLCTLLFLSYLVGI